MKLPGIDSYWTLEKHLYFIQDAPENFEEFYTSIEDIQVSLTLYYGRFPREISGYSVKLTTHLHLVPR
jgi:hypothetical protein